MHEPVVQVDTTIAAPPQDVWKAMKDGAMFPGTTIDTDWEIGHPITFKGEWQGREFTDHGEIQRLNEGKVLSFSHWSGRDGGRERPPSYHVVEYELEPEGEGTHVTLRQFNEGVDREVDEETRAEFEKNWTMMLDSLKQKAEMH